MGKRTYMLRKIPIVQDALLMAGWKAIPNSEWTGPRDIRDCNPNLPVPGDWQVLLAELVGAVPDRYKGLPAMHYCLLLRVIDEPRSNGFPYLRNCHLRTL